MYHIQSFIPKGFWKLMPLLALVILLLSIISCGDNKTTAEPRGCLTLTKDQIQTEWVDRGYFSNSNPRENLTYVWFESTRNPDGSFAVKAQGIKGDGTTAMGDPITLGKGSDCPPGLPNASIKSNQALFSDWNILRDGSLEVRFQNLAFTPTANTSSGQELLEYRAMAYYEDITSDLPSLLPCPPCINCRPKCPTWCTPPCTTNSDTTGTGDSGGVIKMLDTAQRKL